MNRAFVLSSSLLVAFVWSQLAVHSAALEIGEFLILPGPTAYINGQGTPNAYYTIQASDVFLTDTFEKVAAVQADPTGYFEYYDDDAAVYLVRIYRIIPNTCPYEFDARYGTALVFTDGPIDWNTMQFKEPERVCLTDLGIYDSNGVLTADNGGVLTGKYGETRSVSFVSGLTTLPPYSRPGNNFDIDYTGGFNGQPRESIIWSSELHAYYHITDFRNRFFNDAFIDQLGLSAPVVENLKNLQHRPDLDFFGQPIVTAKPRFFVGEEFSASGISLEPDNNVELVPARTRGVEPQASLPPMSVLFDREATVGDYAGLMAFWMTETNQAWPPENGFDSPSFWTNNILPALNDGLNRWVAYRISGHEEVYKYFQYATRTWDNVPCGGTDIACDKGVNLRNVMMYDETTTNADGVFPFQNPVGSTDSNGPRGADLAAPFFGAIFYDIANEIGLGIEKTDLLVWKMISKIDNMNTFPMSTFGDKLLLAARDLWPDGLGKSLYEGDLIDLLASRGVATSIGGSVSSVLPAPIGENGVSLEKNSIRKFASAHPDQQPSIGYPGEINYWWNGYYEPGFSGEYLAIKLYKHSKYGPCDKLALTDRNGNFIIDDESTGEWHYDGKEVDPGIRTGG